MDIRHLGKLLERKLFPAPEFLGEEEVPPGKEARQLKPNYNNYTKPTLTTIIFGS
jgi:hypothetical protein